MANFCSYNTNQKYFSVVDPEKIREHNPLVRVIDDFVERHIDIGAFAEKYTNDEGGAPAKHPRILLKVLFYSYSQGIYSSREIEERISGGDSSFTYLSSNTFLDHSTICNFIINHEAAIRDIFTRMVYILHKFGLVKLNFIAVDGTKVRAGVGERFTGTVEDFRKRRTKIEGRIKEILDKTVSDETSERCRKRMENKVNQLEREKEKIDLFFSEIPKGGDSVDKAKRINLVDRDSVMVKDKKSRYMGYNCQAAVDDEHHFIAGAGVFNRENEKGLLKPMVKELRDRTKTDMKDSELGFDAGYYSSDNIQNIADEELQVYIPEGKGEGGTRRKRNKEGICSQDCILEIDGEIRRLICPGGQILESNKTFIKYGYAYYKFTTKVSVCKQCKCYQMCYKGCKTRRTFMIKKEYFDTYKLRKEMIDKLSTPKGKERLSDRSCTVEHVFGEIKEHYKFRRFTHRGLSKVGLIWIIVCIAYNFRKLSVLSRGSPGII